MKNMRYRPDIDGLRAIAVLSVVLYHAGIGPFQGGFVGVDVFFVISGYLIGKILIGEMADGVFSYKTFYKRRALRLLPALFFVILGSAFAGYFLLVPENYENLSGSLLSATLFLSNFFFFLNVDYFAQDAKLMPLLHTWSLAVEEQFYIVWPVIMALYVYLNRQVSSAAGLVFITCVMGASFIATLMAVSSSQDLAFYMMPFRLWELAAGTLIVLVPKFKYSIKLASFGYFLGLILVLYPIFEYGEHVAFPGASALPVVVGTALMIYLGQASVIPANILRTKIAIYIGKLSYSLYLWHWVVLSYFRVYFDRVDLNGGEVALALSISVIFSIFTYHFVENKVRFGKNSILSLKIVTASAAIVVLVSIVGVYTKGYVGRNFSVPEYAQSRDQMWRWRCERVSVEGLPDRVCVFGEKWDSSEYKYILWGDSHADVFAPLLEVAAREAGVSVLLWRRAPPFIDNKDVKRVSKFGEPWVRRVASANNIMSSWVNQNAKLVNGVIFASAWSGYPSSLYDVDPNERSVEHGAKLIEKGMSNLISGLPKSVSLTIFTDVPRPNKVYLECAYQFDELFFRDTLLSDCAPLDESEVRNWHNPTTKVLTGLEQEFANISTVDMVSRMCSNGQCPIFTEGKILYRDDNHLRRNFTDSVKNKLIEKMGLSSLFVVD